MNPPSRFDEYEIVKPLGRGKSGHVFVARDLLLEREVAIKLITTSEPALLVREARAAARIQHPNVATLYRVGELDGCAYLVWELVRGKSLEQLARPVAPDLVLSIARDVSRGLAAAHRRGVLHRDIKPANIVLADNGEAKLVDFGLAALVDLTDGVARGEGDAPLYGTPYFRAPELWRNEAADLRTDLYALGVVLYELLAGEGPFRHLTVKELAAVIDHEEARPLRSVAPAVPEGLASVVDRCLRRERAARFARAEDVLAALELHMPGRSAAAVPEGNPYRGLRAYDAEHRALFFGRARPLQMALERLRSEPMLVVIGDSGVGKSSLCAAGIVPAVAEGVIDDGRRWLVGRLVPGRTPVRHLADALAGPVGISAAELTRTIEDQPHELGRRVRAALRDELGLLLYLDQMEELVTQATGESARVAEALGALVDGLPGVRVLATTRSDFLSRLAGLPAFAERLPAAIMLLAPMLPGDIREAITGPAAIKGARFESDELVAGLVDSTLGAQGSLPLLQFALAELWDRRDRDANLITETSLASIGGVAGSLARHADGVIVALSAEERTVARSIMLRLVTVDDTRARRSSEELAAVSPLAPKVVEALVRGRLLVASESPDGTMYEIAHEALVRGWDTLARWLADETEVRASRHRLEVAATEWQRLGKRRDLAWSARQLAELDARVFEGLGSREREFIAASQRARKTARWVRRGVLAAAVLAIAGTWAGAKILQRRTISRAIADDLANADRGRVAARDAAAAAANSRNVAYAAWDHQDAGEAERAWADAQARANKARKLFSVVASDYERALLRDSDRSSVRARYGDFLLDRALFADAEGRVEERDELVTRLAFYDPGGQRRAALVGAGRLVIDVTPRDARVELARYDGSDRRFLVPGISQAVGTGAWIATATIAGRPPVRAPLLIERGETRQTALAIPAANAIPLGFIFMPVGDALYGSSDPERVRAWANAVAIHVVQTDAYLIARNETTFGEWIEFLEDLPTTERDKRRPRVVSVGTNIPGTLDLSPTPDNRWRITFQPTEHAYTAAWGEPLRYLKREHRIEQDWRRMPVAGISFDDAIAYVRWLDRTARLPGARLCNEIEWERAARGTADRKFPHGDELGIDDANIDVTYGKQPGGFGPDEVGSHPTSRSPFGVDDLAGNVWEWTISSVVKNQPVVRGGAYYFAARTAQIANRESPEASYRGLTVGVRVCANAQSK